MSDPNTVIKTPARTPMFDAKNQLSRPWFLFFESLAEIAQLVKTEGDPPTFADASENEAGTADDKMVSPLGIRQALNAAGDAPIFAVRAWLTINSTGDINGSGNIASVTVLGAGRFSCTFTEPPPNANYAIVASTNQDNTPAGASDQIDSASYTSKSTAGFSFTTWYSGASNPASGYETSIIVVW